MEGSWRTPHLTSEQYILGSGNGTRSLTNLITSKGVLIALITSFINHSNCFPILVHCCLTTPLHFALSLSVTRSQSSVNICSPSLNYSFSCAFHSADWIRSGIEQKPVPIHPPKYSSQPPADFLIGKRLFDLTLYSTPSTYNDRM